MEVMGVPKKSSKKLLVVVVINGKTNGLGYNRV